MQPGGSSNCSTATASIDFVLDNNYFLTEDILFLSQHLQAASTQTPYKQSLKTTYCNVG